MPVFQCYLLDNNCHLGPCHFLRQAQRHKRNVLLISFVHLMLPDLNLNAHSDNKSPIYSDIEFKLITFFTP